VIKQYPPIQVNPGLQFADVTQVGGLLGIQILLEHVCNLARAQSLVTEQGLPIRGIHIPRTQVCVVLHGDTLEHCWSVAGTQKPFTQVWRAKGQLLVAVQSGPLFAIQKLFIQVCWIVHVIDGKHTGVGFGIHVAAEHICSCGYGQSLFILQVPTLFWRHILSTQVCPGGHDINTSHLTMVLVTHNPLKHTCCALGHGTLFKQLPPKFATHVGLIQICEGKQFEFLVQVVDG
jgi:hypothetical protein